MSERVPHPTVLEGSLVRLVPLAHDHIEPLMRISKATPQEYALTSTPVTDEQAETYFATAFSEREAGRAYVFTAVHLPSGEVIGSSRFADIRWRHRNCELGYTWFRPDIIGTGVNVESKFLMLRFAFETLGWVRVQIHTDTRNTRSRRAIEKLGAVQEGVLRRHMIAKDGFIRDTVVYSLVDQDWARVKEHLLQRLAANGLDVSRYESGSY